MSLSVDLKIESAVKIVTTAGVREPLATGKPDDMRVRSVNIKALTSNGNDVHVGDYRVVNTPAYSRTLSPGETLTYKVTWEGWQHGEAINLSTLYLDADADGEGVCYTVIR